MPTGNFITALDVTPGEDFAVRLSHDSWPDPWPDETAFIFMSPQAMLRAMLRRRCQHRCGTERD